jgi:hypothetical protein
MVRIKLPFGKKRGTMSMKKENRLRAIVLLALIVSLIPFNHPAFAAATLPPADMFQLPWERGLAWVALDGFDDGSDRPTSSPHYYLNGGAIDFAPRSNMIPGEDTSNFWVTAAAAGTVYEMSKCHLKIVHANGWITEYQHLANFQVKLGDVVAQNQRLAVIANALSQPVCAGSEPPDVPHLHFSVRPNMVGATFSGWQFKYNSFWNNTTFSKNGITVGLFKPLLNDVAQPTPTAAATATATQITTSTPDIQATGTAIAQQTMTAGANMTLTASPQQTQTPDNGVTQTAIAQQTQTAGAQATLTAIAQQSQTPDVGATQTAMAQTPTPDLSTLTPTPDSGAYVSTTLNPASIDIGNKSLVTVTLHNTPLEGYSSSEFTCTYNPALINTGSLTVTNLFGADPAVITNLPQAGTLIVAIAGTNHNKAASGVAFTLEATGLQAGQTPINCTARVSKGDNILAALPSFGSDLVILGLISSPTPLPLPTDTPSLPQGDWLTYTNARYAFQFKYPPQGQLLSGNTDTFARINLPIALGTNLSEKYLEVVVAENASLCQSPLATQSILETSEDITINGISFLKQTGGDAGAGNIYQWVAYSTFQDAVCVSLDFILHSHNPGNYPVPPPQFDYTAEAAVFDQIVSTYAWLALPPTNTPTMTPTALPTGMISGKVIAPKPVTVNVYGADNVLIVSMPASLDGSFAVTLPGGSYTIVASASGYLNAQGSFTVTSNLNSTLPVITLPAGDIDNNTVIDQFDALTIGMSYNTNTPSAADLNNDGVINVLDLELLARDYRKIGPVVWQ